VLNDTLVFFQNEINSSGATWGHRPRNFLAVGRSPHRPMESAPMQARKMQTNMERDTQTQRRRNRQRRIQWEVRYESVKLVNQLSATVSG